MPAFEDSFDGKRINPDEVDLTELENMTADDFIGSPEHRLGRAIWEVGGDDGTNSELGDARVVGYAVTAEFLTSAGERWLRHIACSGDGRALPSWQIRGYIEEMHDWFVRGQAGGHGINPLEVVKRAPSELLKAILEARGDD